MSVQHHHYSGTTDNLKIDNALCHELSSDTSNIFIIILLGPNVIK